MRQFECGAVIPGCDAVFQGETDDDVLRQVPDHAREVHGLHELPAALIDQVRGRIHEVP